MERTDKCKKMDFLTILWALVTISVCSIPCSADTIGPIESLPLYGTHTDTLLNVYGTFDMYEQAYVPVIAAYPGTEEDGHGGVVNVYGCAEGNYIYVNPASTSEPHEPVVTIYGPKFILPNETEPKTPPLNEPISGLLRVLSEEGTPLFSLTISSSATDIHLRELTQDPEQLLADLGMYISAQVALYDEEPDPSAELIGIAPELEVSLLAKVYAAADALDRGNPNDAKVAMNDMKALFNQVMAQTDKKISTEASKGIQEYANAIVEALGG